MKSGQFVIGMINGAITSYQSKGAEALLTEREFGRLWKLDEPGIHIYINEAEHVIAKTTITEESDGGSMGRRSTLNHTVIYKFDENVMHDILAHTNFKQLLNQPMPELRNPLPEPEIEKIENGQP